MVEINGTANADFLPGTRLDDVIHGGGGDDVLNGISAHNMLGSGSDTLYGGDGNDTLYGGNGSDFLSGDAGNDALFGGNDGDRLAGGAGDDALTGGGGDDLFAFAFTLATVAVGEEVTLLFRDGETPSQRADCMAWSSYARQLADWRAGLEARYGPDRHAENTFSVDVAVHGNSLRKPAGDPAHFDGDYSFTYEQSVSRTAIVGEGRDTVCDWATGHDTLFFSGLCNDPAAANYWGNWLQSESIADGRTVIGFEGGSITLLGIDTSLADLIARGEILFG